MKTAILLSALSILLLQTQALSAPGVEKTAEDAGVNFQKPRSLENEWRLFKQRFDKFYSTPIEEQYRRLIWEANHWRVLHHNLLASSDRQRSFRLAVNQFADMLPEEFAAKFLTQNKRQLSDHQNLQNRINLPAFADGDQHQDPPPAQVDWRTKGCVSPVKDQGPVDSAAPFQVVGSIEGQICARFGAQRDWLSYQQVIDCANSTNSPEDVYAYLGSNQGMLDWQTPCRGYRSSGEASCSFDPNCVGAIVKGSVDLPLGNESALQLAVAATGPVTVEVDASHTSFQLYESGVYNEPDCTTFSLDHVMLVVGYGVTSVGEAYWVVKNSWGAGWGQQGYILMSRNRGNQCGIATAASYALAQPAQV